jgi:hypothetical protein
MKLMNTKIPYHGDFNTPLWWVIPFAKVMAYVSASFGLSGPIAWYFGWLAPSPAFEAAVPIVSLITLALFICSGLVIVWAIGHNARIETDRNKTS